MNCRNILLSRILITLGILVIIAVLVFFSIYTQELSKSEPTGAASYSEIQNK
jgi:hypothetical protein